MIALPKYVFAGKTPSGTIRYRFRKPGLPTCRLPGEPGSAEFNEAYAKALEAKPAPIGADRTKPGTIDELIVELYRSRCFADLAGSTRDSHRWRLERLRLKYGKAPIADLTSKHLADMLAKQTPVNQKNWLKTFRMLFRVGIAANLAAVDPSKDYKITGKIESIPHQRWEDDDIRQYERCHAIGTKARLAFDLLRYTGLRKSDVVKLGPQHVRKGSIRIKTQKTGEALVLPFDPALASTIAATKVVGTSTFLVTKHGTPHTVKAFGNYFREWCNEAGLPALSAHGIRHTVGAMMSEEGASVPEIMAVLGHRDSRMALHYCRQANQAKLAETAFARLRNRK